MACFFTTTIILLTFFKWATALFMTPSIRVHLKTKRNAIAKSGISYGDYNNSIFHPERNEYIWKENSYFAPILKKKAREVAWYWNHGQLTNEKKYSNEYHHFRIDTYNPRCECYQWKPFPLKKHIYALICCAPQHETIAVTSMLIHPYATEEDIIMCKSDFNQLILFQN